MAGRTRLVPIHGLVAAGCPSISGALLVHCAVGPCYQLPDYAPNDADRDWCARELGDVEARVRPISVDMGQVTIDWDQGGGILSASAQYRISPYIRHEA